MLRKTPPSSIPLWGAVNWHRSMSASGWATSSPTYTNTTMTTHATWWNCFRTISSRRASCDILWRFSKIPDLFQESWRTLQDFENISNILEGTLQYGVYWWLTKNWYQQITNGKCKTKKATKMVAYKQLQKRFASIVRRSIYRCRILRRWSGGYLRMLWWCLWSLISGGCIRASPELSGQMGCWG